MRSDRSRLGGLVVIELAVVAALHSLSRLDSFAVDWSDLSSWPSDSSFEDAFGAAVMFVALGLAYWLLLSTVACLLVSVWDRPDLLGAVRWITLPPIRRLVSRAVALSLAASTLAGPLVPAVADLAGDGAAAGVLVVVDDAGQLHPPGVEDAPAAGDEPTVVIVSPHLRPPAGLDPAGAGTEAPPTPAVEGAGAHRVTVQRGDHLWGLSEQHLQRVWNRTSLGEHEIARYWARVIEANRSSIRSGDPDLIYPGEVITLPIVDSLP